MEEYKMKNISKILLSEKIELVVNKLMHLGAADNESDKHSSAENLKKGIIARDFGIKEWDWPQGVGLYGLEMLQNEYGDNRYDAFLQQWFEDNIAIGLPSRNINTTAPYLTLVDFVQRTGNKTYEKMCFERADWLMNELPKTKEGGFQHVTSALGNRDGVLLNDSELWVDTLFMTVLFLNKMGYLYDREDYKSEARKQVLIHIKYLYEKTNGLFYHGWSFNRNDNFGNIFWCRGNSWFTFGIIDFLATSKDSLDAGVKTYILDTFKAQAKTLKDLQAPSGLWHTVLTDSTSYEEVSGSAAIATGLLKGARLGLLDDSYKACALRAIHAICDNIDSEGTVLNVSAGTGMGMDVDHYKNIILAPMAYGQSLTLVALCEALKESL